MIAKQVSIAGGARDMPGSLFPQPWTAASKRDTSRGKSFNSGVKWMTAALSFSASCTSWPSRKSE